jgi:hypothetical protein
MVVLPLCSIDGGEPRTDHILGKVDGTGETRVLCGAATIARARIPEVNRCEPSIAETFDEERDAGPVKATKRRRIDQTNPVLDTGCSNESPICR